MTVDTCNTFQQHLSFTKLIFGPLQIHSLSQGRFTVSYSQRSKHCSQGLVQQLLHIVGLALQSQWLLLLLFCTVQVTRDNLLRDFRAPETEAKCNTEYGSGYPGGVLNPKPHHVYMYSMSYLYLHQIVFAGCTV